jgi:hypothetical protein
LPENRLAPLLDESGQLVRMLSKAVARAKGKHEAPGDFHLLLFDF